jgi:hypothetical protein
VLETEKRRKEKDCKRLAVCSRSSAQSGTPNCPVVHRTVSGAPGWTPVKRPLSGKVQRRTTIIHRTVRWCTGLSGEPTVASAMVGRANGRLRQKRKDIGTGPSTVTVRWRTGLSGAPLDRRQGWPSLLASNGS